MTPAHYHHDPDHSHGYSVERTDPRLRVIARPPCHGRCPPPCVMAGLGPATHDFAFRTEGRGLPTQPSLASYDSYAAAASTGSIRCFRSNSRYGPGLAASTAGDPSSTICPLSITMIRSKLCSVDNR